MLDVIKLFGETTLSMRCSCSGRPPARLPFGVPDPILWRIGSRALHRHDLWPVGELQVIAADTRPLTAELFAAGFRWDLQRPLYLGRGLWHPQLQIRADVIEDHALASASAEALNVLSVTVDWPLARSEQVLNWPRSRSSALRT